MLLALLNTVVIVLKVDATDITIFFAAATDIITIFLVAVAFLDSGIYIIDFEIRIIKIYIDNSSLVVGAFPLDFH